MKERLDRFLANLSWSNLFLRAKAINSAFFGSDHRAVKVQLNLQKWVRKTPTTKRFMFENKWLVEEDFSKVASKAWEQSKNANDLPDGLETCGKIISNQANTEVGNTKRKIEQLSREIEEEYLNEENEGPTETITNKERLLEKLMTQEELHWHQRSKKNWLKAGDKNTTFFHQCTRARRSRNYIDRLISEDGHIVTTMEDLNKCITSYYNDLFVSSSPSWDNVNQVLAFVEPLVDKDMNRFLNWDFTMDDIKCVVFDLSPSKVPGPDGFTMSFFQHEWEVVNVDLSEATLGILNRGGSLEKWNETTVSLIPKVKKLE